LEAIRLLSGSEAVRVITLTGAGRAFCAGADLGVLGSEGPALVAAGKDVVLALRAAPQPVLAVVNGAAAGGGANLALACDYRWAAGGPSNRCSTSRSFTRTSYSLRPRCGSASPAGRQSRRGAADGTQAEQLG